MGSLPKAKRPKRPTPRSCLGPVSDLEAHLPAEWWRKLFNALYVKTDGDVVENSENTRREVDFIVAASGIRAAIEVKSTEHAGDHHLGGLRAIVVDHRSIGHRILVCLEPKRRVTVDGIEILPVTEFLERLWKGTLLA